MAKETKCFDFLSETIYRNSCDSACSLCTLMHWDCPFNPDVEENQDPDGTICRDFLREHISAALKNELS